MRKVSITIGLPQAVMDGIVEFRKDFDDSLPAGIPKPSRTSIISMLLRRALTAEGVELVGADDALDISTGESGPIPDDAEIQDKP